MWRRRQRRGKRFDEPICSCGRIKLVPWVREKVVTRSLHRYGNIVYSRW